MRTRSIENRVFTLTANRTGTERRPGGTVPFTGRSQVVAPSGDVLVRAGKGATVASAVDLDLAESRKKSITAMTPIFANRRPEHYGLLVRRVRAGAAARRATPSHAARRTR
jgi:predicted amidohydrolase